MGLQDHEYASTTQNRVMPLGFTYKMSSKETEEFVKLRVSNSYLFAGRRKTSGWAWRAILKHLGLHDKMTHIQASKKWENMKKRYRELKNPLDGVKVFPETWPYFTLMDDAMEGRLQGGAPILKAFSRERDEDHFLPNSTTKRRKISMVVNSSTDSLVGGPEIEVSLNGEEGALEDEEGQEMERIMQEVDDERNRMDNERQAMDREKRVMERERLVLQRERAALDRELAALDRDRASLERERAAIEREKAALERERTVVEKDRDAVGRDRLALEREKARLERLCASTERTEEVTEDASQEKDLDRKERFLNLFEKLIENF